jgi:hypothetical protein
MGAIGGGDDGVMRADCSAGSAESAAIRGVEDLGLERLTFGIVTPPAREGAALEEDSRANAGSVVDGKTHDIKDEGGLSVPDHKRLYSEIKISGSGGRTQRGELAANERE